jgi:hypothetical protein
MKVRRKKNTKKRKRFRNLTRKEEENKKENFKRVIIFKALEIITSQFQS